MLKYFHEWIVIMCFVKWAFSKKFSLLKLRLKKSPCLDAGIPRLIKETMDHCPIELWKVLHGEVQTAIWGVAAT